MFHKYSNNYTTMKIVFKHFCHKHCLYNFYLNSLYIVKSSFVFKSSIVS